MSCHPGFYHLATDQLICLPLPPIPPTPQAYYESERAQMEQAELAFIGSTMNHRTLKR